MPVLLGKTILLSILVINIFGQSPDVSLSSTNTANKVSEDKPDSLPPCLTCKKLATSFLKGMDRTSRGKFEGGDASWEESRLGTYADSEIRLVEIQERLCSDLEKGTDECQRLAEKHENLLEEWWFRRRKDVPDLVQFLCIDSLKVCCQENHFGPDCAPCVGGGEMPCSGHGQCKGAGTRKGSGQCKCNEGYFGEICDKCRLGYYKDPNAPDLICQKCDKSCRGHCREGGSKGCEVCADGYQHTLEFGCIDTDECIEMKLSSCPFSTFCVNTIGSYYCIDCDKSCNGCTGDGPDMCIRCSNGYVLQDNVCIETSVWHRSLHIEIARYATYTGLCLATFIIFRRNTLIASLIGVFVAVYIGLSEYTLGDWDKRSILKAFKSWLMI